MNKKLILIGKNAQNALVDSINSKDKIIVMNMCGRGDKDIFIVAKELKIKL